MAKVAYKMCWIRSILNQSWYEELPALLDKRSTADVRQVNAFHEMTKETVWESTTVTHITQYYTQNIYTLHYIFNVRVDKQLWHKSFLKLYHLTHLKSSMFKLTSTG